MMRTLGLGLGGLLTIGSLAAACEYPWVVGYSPVTLVTYRPIVYAPPIAYLHLVPSAAIACPTECVVPLARPQPAPPSSGPGPVAPPSSAPGPIVPQAGPRPQEPPLGRPLQKVPMISHSRSVGGVVQNPDPRQPLCKVSFWNLSGFDVDLSVGDKVHRVAKDRAAVLNLDRVFTWRTQFHSPKGEAVADDLNHYEVLIK